MIKQDITTIWNAAIAAVHPAYLMRQYISIKEDCLLLANEQIPLNTFQNLYLIGVGKASGAMAVEVADILGEYLTDSLVTIKHGHEVDYVGINMISASHPIPDEHSVEAVNNTLQFLKKVKEEDIVILLLSGGASALWCDIPEGLNMDDLSWGYQELVNSGATIEEVNIVRKHLSSIKGGQLIKYCQGRLITLIISDVPGDDLSIIGSAPTFPDTSTFQESLEIIHQYKLTQKIPEDIVSRLRKGVEGEIPENPKPGDSAFLRVSNTIIGSNKIAVSAAAKAAAELGYNVYVSDKLVTGETQEEAKELIGSLLQHRFEKPCCIIQGGETVIRVTGTGKGGRNQHFALAALKELTLLRNQINAKDVILLSCGTDGTDGPTDAAGAVISLTTLDWVAEQNISIEEYLDNHDAYSFFEKVGGLIRTGPTQTNVMDIQIMIVI
ncbi:glycerate kinase type-2 family protein [Pseudopedobacter beijingensis]|uniref:Glycerate kinase n=1 Tax=Pseudopedobacter beijingensis TaxID=1207056 RepID=A0ABW4ID94_9SPHI